MRLLYAMNQYARIKSVASLWEIITVPHPTPIYLGSEFEKLHYVITSRHLAKAFPCE